MLNKPPDHVTACRDEIHPTVMDCFGEMREGLHPVGRLDLDTTGLLIVTDDGGFDNRILQPSVHVEKCYRFGALGDLTDDAIARLAAGITISGGIVTCQAKVRVESRSKIREHAQDFPENLREGWLKNPDGGVVSGTITITEGRFHQIKRMLKAAGCRVFSLERIRMGGLTLDPTLAPGEWRAMSIDEVNAILPDYLDKNGVPTMARCWQKSRGDTASRRD